MNRNEIVDWISDNKSRVFSVIVSVSYIFFFNFFQHSRILVGRAIFWGLICIWLGEMVKAKGIVIRGVYISESTPGCFIVFIGWVILLMPCVFEILGRLGVFD